MFRIALDPNVLACLAGVGRAPNDGNKIDKTRDMIARLNEQATLIARVQALGELFVVLSRAGFRAEEARLILIEFSQSLETADSSMTIMASALDLPQAGRCPSAPARHSSSKRLTAAAPPLAMDW